MNLDNRAGRILCMWTWVAHCSATYLLTSVKVHGSSLGGALNIFLCYRIYNLRLQIANLWFKTNHPCTAYDRGLFSSSMRLSLQLLHSTLLFSPSHVIFWESQLLVRMSFEKIGERVYRDIKAVWVDSKQQTDVTKDVRILRMGGFRHRPHDLL